MPTLAIPIFAFSLVTVSYIVILFVGRNEQNRTLRLQKRIGSYLVWFILNGLYMIVLLNTPVFYEPGPVEYGSLVVYFYLPFTITLSIPYLIHLVHQWRKT